MEKKIALYARVSTMQQADDGFGLDVQLKELRALAEASGHQYIEYIDRGISGTDIEKRLGLQELLEEIKNDSIKEVWVTKLSRLGRNSRDVLNIIHEFEKYDVKFKSVKDGIDTTNHMGKIMLQFMAIIAEMERDVIIETTRAGAEYRAAIGKIYGSPAILGYDRVHRDKETLIEINIEEAKIVKRIFNLYAGGHGYKSIVSKLNSEGLRSKKGNMFSIASIKSILGNPIYIGKIRYNYHKDWNKKRRRGKQDEYIFVDGVHDAIIDEDTFNKVQAKMAENGKGRQASSGKFLLNSILKCPQCGSSMVAAYRYNYTKSGRVRIASYACGAHHNKGRAACRANLVNAKVVEEAVLERVSEVLNSDETADLLHTFIVEQATNSANISKLLNSLENDIHVYEDKINRVKEMYEEGYITKKAMIEKVKKHELSISETKEQRASILDKQSSVEKVEINVTKEEIKDILKSLYNTLTQSSDRLLVKDFLKVIIKEIRVKNRLKPDMEISLSFTENLLQLFEKEIPKGITFQLNQEI